MEKVEHRPYYVNYWDNDAKVGIYAIEKGVWSTVWLIRIYTDNTSARAIGMFNFQDDKEADAVLKRILKHTTPERLKRIHSKIKEHAEEVERRFHEIYIYL